MDRVNEVSKTKTKYLVTASLFAALVCLTTAYILHIPVGVNGGYVHIGDSFIYLAAAILPTPYAMICAAIGAGMADLVSGAAIWVIPAIIIKPILVLFISSNSEKIITKRNIVGSFIAGFVGWFLYMIAGGIISGRFVGAFVLSLVGFVQPIGSFIVFLLIGSTFDKLEIKKKF